MIRGGLWRNFESGTSFPLRAVRLFALAAGIVFLAVTGILELTWPQQVLLGLLIVLPALWIARRSNSYMVTLTLIFLSTYSTFRYGYWRVSNAIKFLTDPGIRWSGWDAFFIGLLMVAELYAFLILYLGYVQTLWPLRRAPVPLPDDPRDWPAVDLLIPTYNEPLNVVRYTVLAALNIDWPPDKLKVYILDDGRREEFRAFAEEAGIGYITRDGNEHAKAGNINHALKGLKAPLVAVFDCDHVPTRSFLQVTAGWFVRDEKLGMLQTPHHFYSPDPFERNLRQFRTIPNEGELFYGIVQDGNDFWNATFFCGSCAVLRRTALDEVGGMAVETVTEDAHTSLRMQMKGWNTAYINIPQAAGLATESLSGHVKQRVRWARGMVQVMRIDNPLFAPGLSFSQRLCYFNAMSHFLYALPRLIFLTAPLIYLLLGRVNVPGYWAAILAYALPHLILANATNSRIQGRHRHSFWNQIYETILSPYILLPTLLALVSPKLGRFDVTAKGGVIVKRYFDARLATPFLLLLALDTLGLLMAIPRYFYVPIWPLRLVFDGSHPGTIVMNVIWTLFNMVILGVCTAVAWESQQRRTTVRVAMAVPADLLLSGGKLVRGVTADISNGGVAIKIDAKFAPKDGETIQLIFRVLDGDAILPASVVETKDGVLRAQFETLTLEEEEALTMMLYSRADTWLGWGETREADRPLQSLGRILGLSLWGFRQMFFVLAEKLKGPEKSKRKLATSLVPLIALICLFGSASRVDGAAPVMNRSPILAPDAKAVLAGQFQKVFKLSDANVADTIKLRGIDGFATVRFSLPQTEVVKTAAIHLKYHFSPALIPALSHLKVSLNGTLFATLPVTSGPMAEGQGIAISRDQAGALLEATLPMPAEMLVHDNELTFEFIGHYTTQCEDPANSALWAEIDPDSTIELAGALLLLENDLKLLPLPFYDAAVDLKPSIPIVFLSPPSPQAMQAAGIVTSWFGMMAMDHPARFPVSFGTIPPGNAIVIAENPADIPAALNVTETSGPAISMRTNPVDPYSKLLVISGDRGADVVQAAMALTLQRDMLQGDQARIAKLISPKPREADDAPRWMSTEATTHLGDIATTAQLQGGNFVPLDVYLRIPPDLYFGERQNLPLHLGYRYNPLPLTNGSTLQVFMNNAYVSSTPIPHEDNASASRGTVLAVPVANLRPFSNTLKMMFLFQIAKKGYCEDSPPTNLQGAIMKDSFLDIKGMPHWATLPNLELFANAGYPFTRKADLSETAVVLPDAAAPEEIEAFLTLMGHFGAQTGYPVTNVTVTDSEGMKADAKKDYIVLGTLEDEPAIGRINPNLPVMIGNDRLRIKDTDGFFAPLERAWWKLTGSVHDRPGALETEGGVPDALIEAIVWPRGSSRSVVVLALRDRAAIPNFLAVFLKSSQSSDISQSVSVLRGDRFTSYRLGGEVYHVGSLAVWTRLQLLFSEFSWLFAAAIVLVALLMALLVRGILRQRARDRLLGAE